MNTDTPRTDEVAWPETGLVEGDFARELERELTAARAEIERLDVSGIHTCHDKCQRWTCVMRRELKAVTEQRDRLAEAMTRIVNIYENPEKGCIPSSSDMYDEALQFITPKNHE